MSDWTRVADEGGIDEGGFLKLNIDGAPIAVFYIGGEYLSIEDVCSHDGGQLTGGPLHGCQIECPRHGALFDIATGQALTLPATEPVTRFPVKIENGVVYTRDDRWD